MTPETTSREKVLNGVSVTRMMETIANVQQDPQIADFRFRVSNAWQTGARNEAVIADFYGAKENRPHVTPFVIQADEPAVLLGTDKGPNPVETLLAALSGCMTTTLAYHAAARDCKIEKIASEYQGGIDLQGFLGLRGDVNKGFNDIHVKFKVKGDMTAEEIREIVQNSPVFDTLRRPINITIDVEKE